MLFPNAASICSPPDQPLRPHWLFAQPSPPIQDTSKPITAWSIAAALALTALTPSDPLAHTALSISLQSAGHIPQAEAAAARARVLEWKIQLEFPPAAPSERDSHP
jgi:hypothetical protein